MALVAKKTPSWMVECLPFGCQLWMPLVPLRWLSIAIGDP